jgi:hypothetical protein
VEFAIVLRRIACLAAVVVVVAASGASAAPMHVGFESDPTFVVLANGFTSSDSSQIHFSDTSSVDMIILEEASGNNALIIGGNDDSGLLIELDFDASALSLDFGYTTFNAVAGENAVLTLWLGGTVVDSVVVALDVTDGGIGQSIAYQGGVSFDSATFRYDVALGLAEVVDNIQVTPAIPEPHAGLVFGMGALLVGAVCRRRSPAEVGLRAEHS